MYETPINIYYTNPVVEEYVNDIVNELDRKQEEMIMTAIQRVYIDVNKEELIKAMNYDRQQYEKGYADAKAEIIRCRDCIHWMDIDNGRQKHFMCAQIGAGDWYCADAERRENERHE